MSRLAATLPLTFAPTTSPLVLVGSDLAVLSEHENTPNAVKALARFAAKFPASEAAIYRRLKSGWVRY